ncbi:hypothetical protein LF1_06070 [Rubripirellula obstinata]|uniref:Uncharacterized protein n=1 Tax=Rubripirellula obstinata TaxID=406547 RepID=A0A5B1CD06_9BACT|nr:hypothetical protein [Rubripirellula obstinata]KAA1258092.1 hypothetical protein LF1_06070 [Rubripirellula obstinata]
MAFKYRPGFSCPSLAPDVELEMIRRLVWQELDRRDQLLVHLLIASFHSWHDVYKQIVIEELNASYCSNQATKRASTDPPNVAGTD